MWHGRSTNEGATKTKRTIVVKREGSRWVARVQRGVNGWVRANGGKEFYATKREALADAQKFADGFKARFGIDHSIEVK